jgi:hypothetical protein
VADPILHLRVDTPASDSLWEDEWTFPFRGPTLKDTVAAYLENHTRCARTTPAIDLTFRFADPPLTPEAEAEFLRNYHAFFEVKAEDAELDRDVNRREGLRSLYLGTATSILAAVLVVLLDLTFGLRAYGIYFILLVLVWVLMWDSIEKLVFDSMFLRMRARALVKLRDARVTFER